jgi:hypothetical protein
MKNSTNSTAVLVVNLIADATGIQPPSEWIQHLSISQNAERIDRQVNSPYYKNADYVRRNRAYTPLLRTCGRLSRTFLDDLTDTMGQDNMVSISYNDIEHMFGMSRPSIYPCIQELAERGILIYTPGTSGKNPSTFYINPKIAGSAKMSHQQKMEREFDETLKKQPAMIISKKHAIPDGITCLQRFYQLCRDLGINEDENEDNSEFTVIPITDKKNRFYTNEIRATHNAAPNPKKIGASAGHTDTEQDITSPTIHSHNNSNNDINAIPSADNMQKKNKNALSFENDPEIPFN